MWDYADRGSNEACPHCGISARNQHTLSESGLCDAIKAGKFAQWKRDVGKVLRSTRPTSKQVVEETEEVTT